MLDNMFPPIDEARKGRAIVRDMEARGLDPIQWHNDLEIQIQTLKQEGDKEAVRTLLRKWFTDKQIQEQGETI